MRAWLEDPDVRLYHGDALSVLRKMPSESVHAIVTSPPYFGLRDYGQPEQIGLEPSPDAYVQSLVEVFREARRVLRSDGVCWLNLGDSYTSTGSNGDTRSGFNARYFGSGQPGKAEATNEQLPSTPRMGAGCKPKDLLGIPWLVAFALRQDGWCLRSEVIWSKPNPMPESVTDRPTKAHEQLFLLTKAKWTGAEEPMPMREADATWLAALIDGEGSICFQERERADGGPHVGIRLSIVNTNRALLDRVTEITSFGEHLSPSPRPRNDGNAGRPVFTWQVTNAKAARIISAVRPYLIAKRTQADLALYVHELNQGHRGRGGHVTRPADLASKRRAAAACSALNRGLPVDLSWFVPPKPGRWIPNPYSYDADAIREPIVFEEKRMEGPRPRNVGGRTDGLTRAPRATFNEAGRNARSVWSIATEPTPYAHFATMPTQLVARCIKAGTSEYGCCSECGAPWARIVEREGEWRADHERSTPGSPYRPNPGGGVQNGRTTRREQGWQPTCECWVLAHRHHTPAPCVVLDPFSGSATTALVARRLGRHAIGIELNADYLTISAKRLEQLSLLAGDVA